MSSENKLKHLILQGYKLMHFKLMVYKVLENLEGGIPVKYFVLLLLSDSALLVSWFSYL